MRLWSTLVGAGVIAVAVYYVAVATPRFQQTQLAKVEARYDSNLRLAASLWSSSNNGSLPARWEDLRTIFGSSLLIQMEQAYLRLPRSLRGFEKSIYEKYVFVVPPLGTRLLGEDRQVRIFMIATRSRRTSGTNALRTVFWHDGKEVRSGSLQEAEVKAVFAEANRNVPQAQAAAPATPVNWSAPGRIPPLDRETLSEVLRERGCGPVAIWWVLYWPWSGVTVASASIVCLIFVVRLLERRKRS